MNELNQAFKIGIQHRIFNNEVRKRRVALGLTQKQLGLVIDKSHTYLSALESFRLFPTEEDGIKLAEVLQSTPQELFPKWLEYFKPKQTTIISEHEVTPQMLTGGLSQFLLESGDEQNMIDSIDKDFLKEEIDKVMDSLSPREVKVLKLRFGLGTEKQLTLEDTAQVFRVTRERIRQIEAKAIRKLKHPSRASKLKGFFNNSI